MKTRSILKKGLTHLLAIVMVVCSLTALGVVKTDEAHAAMDGIAKGNSVSIGVENSYYSGTADWNVLKVVDSDNDGKGEKALLLSKKLWTGDGTSDETAKIKFADNSNSWDGSNAKAWCEAFYSNILLNCQRRKLLTQKRRSKMTEIAGFLCAGFLTARSA